MRHDGSEVELVYDDFLSTRLFDVNDLDRLLLESSIVDGVNPNGGVLEVFGEDNNRLARITILPDASPAGVVISFAGCTIKTDEKSLRTDLEELVH